MQSRFARSLFAASIALTSSLVGCAAPEETEELDHEDLVANADEVVEEHEVSSLSQAIIYDDGYECTSTTLTCMPDLTTTLASVVKYEVGNTAGKTPGFYVTFSIKNRGGKSADAFEVDILDGFSKRISSRSLTGLAPGATRTVTQYLPLGCGWGIKALADADKTVVEYSETNNLASYWYSCPYSVPANTDDGSTTIGGTVPVTTLP